MLKKYISVILAAVLVLLCTACDKKAQKIEMTGDDDLAHEGLSVQILQVEATDKETVLHVQWCNNTEYPIMYGEGFSLLKWENDQWVECPMKENTAFISIGYQLEPGKTRTKPYALNWAFGELTKGHYRFITSCSVMLPQTDAACKLSAEFDIVECPDSEMPISGETNLYIAGEVVSLNAEQAMTVYEILTGLAYDQNQSCNCQPEYKLTLSNGITYGIHLGEAYARCDHGQSKLTDKQVNALTVIIDWALEITKAR